jgi:long-chain acyl-CoA synthetase
LMRTPAGAVDDRVMHTETLIRPAAGDDPTAGLPTICAAFQATVARYPNRVALRLPEEQIEWTFDEYAARVRRGAAMLHALGVRRGETVALLLRNRPEHLVADLAVLHLGATPFSLYATCAPHQVQYIMRDSGAKVLITEAALAETVAAVEPFCPRLEHVLRLTSGGSELNGVETPHVDFDQAWRELGPDDVACLVYTSGTTGPPKGAEITHAGLLANLRGTWRSIRPPQRYRVISFLPPAHILGRLFEYYSPALLAGTVTCCPDASQLPAKLAQTRPTVLVAPPRAWEKLRAKCEALGADPRAFANGAGLGEVEAAVVGAAPVPLTLLEYWQAAGVPLRQGWGMTELSCCGALTSDDPADNGTCGRPIDGLQLRIAGDGEVLARGRMVIRGYRNLPEQTAQAIDPDGWLHTGDIGRIDERGRLTIVDRKKELIINSAGKNMSPANIEAELKSASPLIGQACCIGNDRAYNIALIVLEPEVAARYPDNTARAAEIQRGVAAANTRLSRVEQIKRFTILDTDWLPGGEELTPTMKLKRKPIEQKYAAVINALYAPAAAGERTRRPPAQNEPPDRTGEPKGQTDA